MCDNRPIPLRQSFNSSQQSPIAVFADNHGLGRWGRIPRDRVTAHPESKPFPPTSRPDPVQRLITDDPQQPGPEPRSGSEPAKRPVRLDQSLLGHVLRLTVVPYHQISDPKRHPLVGKHQLLEGIHITVLRPGNQLLFIQWTALWASPRIVEGFLLMGFEVMPL